jgi:hypothetical protein
VSSTFVDLSAVRGEICKWLTGLFGAELIVMETFGSDAAPPEINSVRRVRERGFRVRSCNITFQKSTRKQRLSDRITDEAKHTLYTSSNWEGSRSRKARWSIRSHSSFPDKIFIDGLPVYDLW